MPKSIQHIGPIEAASNLDSVVDGDGAAIDFDAATSYARFTAKGGAGASRGAKIRTLLIGAVVDAIIVAANGVVTLLNSFAAPSAVIGSDPGGPEPLRVGGAVRASGGFVAPSAVSLDTSGNAVAMANNASATLTLAAYVSFEISEITVAGNTARVTVTNHVLSIDGQTGADYSTVSGTAAKTNLTFAAGVLTIQNKLGAPAEYRLSVRKRA